MSITLACPDLAWSLEVPLPDDVFQALCHQYFRAEGTDGLQQLSIRLAQRLPEAIIGSLDSDLRPPSEEQRRFAQAIAQRLQLKIPADALTSRSGMAEFIGRHIAEFRLRSSRPSPR